jgi:hypothetical protein
VVSSCVNPLGMESIHGVLPGRPGGLLVATAVTSKGKRVSWRVCNGVAEVKKPRARGVAKRELRKRMLECDAGGPQAANECSSNA